MIVNQWEDFVPTDDDKVLNQWGLDDISFTDYWGGANFFSKPSRWSIGGGHHAADPE